jgi:hypothetical protein
MPFEAHGRAFCPGRCPTLADPHLRDGQRQNAVEAAIRKWRRRCRAAMEVVGKETV